MNINRPHILTSLLAVILNVAALPSLHADVLCYSTKSSNNNLRIYKNSCPKNFKALSAEIIGVNKVFAQGLPGAQGVAGATGLAGPQGLQGDKGAIGDEGSKGAVGAQGLTGPQGDPGLKGATGDSGAPGFSASDLFFFNGGTGTVPLGSVGTKQIYPFNQTGGPTTTFINTADLLVPIGSRCSTINFVAALDVAPGTGNTWQFSLLNGNYASAPTQIPLCSMNEIAKNCSFTLTLPTPLTANTSIALVADKLATSPPNTGARWSLRCTAS